MKEAEAKDFDLPGINHESTPVSVRLLPKKPGTHRSPVPEDEWSIYVSEGSFRAFEDEWKALALAVEHAGWNADATERGIAIW